MPITIKEIIASDTISQLVDKTNFNFDQLLLNGGGPSGPRGLIGPVGPSGGRGPKGTVWYNGLVSPNVTAPTATPLISDYYLQDSGTTPPTAGDGDVWEYTGLTWSNTGVNIIGPVGPAGASGGFGKEFGGPVQITKQTARTNNPIGLGNGATAGAGGNEGVPSVMIGGVVSNSPALTGIPLTAAYIVPDTIATTLISTTASLMIHQKDSAVRGIVFHGGNAAGNNDKFEQLSIGELSGIYISRDDRLVLDVPKPATTPSGQAELIGFEVNAPERSHLYTAGKDIAFSTGVRNNTDVSPENSNFTVSVGNGSDTGGNIFSVTTSGTTGSSLMEMGNTARITEVTQQSARVGTLQFQTGTARIVSNSGYDIGLYSGRAIDINTASGTSPNGRIRLNSSTGGIGLDSAGGAIAMRQTVTTAVANIVIENSSTASGGDIRIQGNRLITLKSELFTSLEAPSIVIDQAYTLPFTRFTGKQTISDTGLATITYPPTAHNTLIYKDPTTVVSTVNSIFELTGTAGNTDYEPGIFLQAWAGGVQAVSGLSAGMPTVNLGSEGPISPVTGTAYNAYDNTLGFGIRDQANTKDYFNASANKISIAAPLVLKRAQGLNSSINNNPNTSLSMFSSSWASNPAPAPLNYGWNSIGPVPPNSTGTGTGTTFGMPTTAELNVPYISLNFGLGLGERVGGSGPFIMNKPNWGGGIAAPLKFNFPTGAYPGQRIVLKIYNQAIKFSTNIDFDGTTIPNEVISNYGGIQVNIPAFRQKVPSTAANWTSWWGSASVTSTSINAFTAIVIPQTSTGAAEGIGIIRTIDMIWDGQIIEQDGGTVIGNWPGSNTPNRVRTKVQFGWNILTTYSTTTDGFTTVATSGWSTTANPNDPSEETSGESPGLN